MIFCNTIQKTFLIGFVLSLIRCQSFNPLSPGPQPSTLEPVRHENMLNVFGVLRPDSLYGMSASYVHLESTYPSDDIPDSSRITDASVRIVSQRDGIPDDSLTLTYTDLDSFPTLEYRNASFFPQSGSFRMTCEKTGYPVLTGQTVIPDIPMIRENSMIREEGGISFFILRDEKAGLYEVVLKGSGLQYSERFIRPSSGDVHIWIPVDQAVQGETDLTIYAFDQNLAEYLTANLSIKPNIYQAPFSTVEQGYGCFGSLNIYQQRGFL